LGTKKVSARGTIQHEGGHHIDFQQISVFPGQTTANNCKTAFSLYVVESASDDYNFQLLFGPKNQSFRNKSGKAQPIRTKFVIPGHVKGYNAQGILGAIRPFWAKWTSPAEPEFFCVVIQVTFRQLRNGRLSPNLATKHSSVSRRGIHTDIFENFHFRGHLPPKSEIEYPSNRHLTQSRLQVMGCTDRHILFTPRCSPTAREFRRSGQLFSTMYGCGATGYQICTIFGFWPIFPIQTSKTYHSVTRLHPSGYIAE